MIYFLFLQYPTLNRAKSFNAGSSVKSAYGASNGQAHAGRDTNELCCACGGDGPNTEDGDISRAGDADHKLAPSHGKRGDHPSEAPGQVNPGRQLLALLRQGDLAHQSSQALIQGNTGHQETQVSSQGSPGHRSRVPIQGVSGHQQSRDLNQSSQGHRPSQVPSQDNPSGHLPSEKVPKQVCPNNLPGEKMSASSSDTERQISRIDVSQSVCPIFSSMLCCQI